MGFGETVRTRLTSASAWRLPKESSCIAPDEVWSNKDMDPSPPEDRRYTGMTLSLFWACDILNAGTWATVSSFIAGGLTVWEAFLAMLLGGFLCSIVISANAYIGATTHTPFAVTSRATYGYWGSKFVVVSRCVIACFWLAINSWTAGQFVTLMITAIWPSYARVHNSIPASQGATTTDFISFFIFWLIQAPFVLIHPSKLGWVFKIKSVLVPIVAIGTLIWACKITGSAANVNRAIDGLSNRASPGLERFVAFCSSVTAAMGIWSTLSLNIGDFSRYCRRPGSTLVQLAVFPLLYAILSIFASITAACCYQVYGDALYQPYMVVAKWGTSHGGRAAMFLGSLVWVLANATTNISANAISASNDLVSLLPKYANIKRGQMFACTVGVWAFAPWKVLNSAANFLTFMSSYSIVLAPLAALMATDFFFVKKGKYNIYHLYRPHGIYRYTYGWNWRAYAALIPAVALNLPGMINAIDSKVNIGNVSYIYMLSNITGDFIAVSIYLILNKFFPAHDALIEEAVHDVAEYQEALAGMTQGVEAGLSSGGEGDFDEKDSSPSPAKH